MSQSTSSPQTYEGVPGGSRRERILRSVRSSAPIFVVLITIIACITYVSPFFLDPPIFLAFLRRAAPLMILAAGQFFVIVSGEVDLSVGSLVTVVVVVAARLSDGDPVNTWWILFLLASIGIVVGLINGIVTTRFQVPSIIATLGMLLILYGLVFLWTGGAPKGNLAENFRAFGRGGIEDLPLLGTLPYSVILLVAVGTIATFLLHRADFGRKVFAVGGEGRIGSSARAARLSGVNVPNVRTIAFILSALSAVVAGILIGGFSGISAQVGEGLEFEVIAAVVLGGAVLGGGRGAMPAVMAGALTLVALFTLLNFLGVPGEFEETIQGVIIIGAVAFAALRVHRD